MNKKTSLQLKAEIKELEKQLKRQEKEEEKQKEKQKMESIQEAKRELEQFTVELLKKYGLNKKELSIKEIETSKSNIKKPPKPIYACLDASGSMQSITGKKSQFWKVQTDEFLNRHKVTHRKLINNRWFFWNLSLGEKPNWATNETVVIDEN